MIKNLHLIFTEAEIIFSSLRNLSDNGLALFIVSPAIKSRSRNIFEFIKDIDCLEGIFIS